MLLFSSSYIEHVPKDIQISMVYFLYPKYQQNDKELLASTRMAGQHV